MHMDRVDKSENSFGKSYQISKTNISLFSAPRIQAKEVLQKLVLVQPLHCVQNLVLKTDKCQFCGLSNDFRHDLYCYIWHWFSLAFLEPTLNLDVRIHLSYLTFSPVEILHKCIIVYTAYSTLRRPLMLCKVFLPLHCSWQGLTICSSILRVHFACFCAVWQCSG